MHSTTISDYLLEAELIVKELANLQKRAERIRFEAGGELSRLEHPACTDYLPEDHYAVEAYKGADEIHKALTNCGWKAFDATVNIASAKLKKERLEAQDQ